MICYDGIYPSGNYTATILTMTGTEPEMRREISIFRRIALLIRRTNMQYNTASSTASRIFI